MKDLLEFITESQLTAHFQLSIEEDHGSGTMQGDHSSLACFPDNLHGKAQLMIKADGLIAGMALIPRLFHHADQQLQFTLLAKDGDTVKAGQVIMHAEGPMVSLLSIERIMLNYLQRLSGIATQTQQMVQLIAGTKATLLDTRKTTPGWRGLEKWAVQVGGAKNHRMGLYDMIMLKDNHVDFSGGIAQAVSHATQYLKDRKWDMGIEVETRNLDEVDQALQSPGVTRIMLDNFSPEQCKAAVQRIGNRCETEASGNLNSATLLAYAQSGVDYLSMGALTHSVTSLDMNFKATCKD